MEIERWVVDEITEGAVRVLRSRLRASRREDVSPAVEPIVNALEPAAEETRAVAIALEALPTDAWTRETDELVDLVALEALLVGGAQVAAPTGLPVRPELREGDVYWLVRPDRDAVGVVDAEASLRTVDDAAELLATLALDGTQVWDVTAAARQAIKRRYADALVARPSERPNPDQQPPQATRG